MTSPVLIVVTTVHVTSSVSNTPSLSSSKSIKSPTPSLSVSVHAFIDETTA